MAEAKERLIKSKERVRRNAEVYTPSWLVNDMCDMLSSDAWDDIHRTFLEPSCGNGSFLVEILARKLKLCDNIDDGISALQSIFGIDILPDNVQESRDRMYGMFMDRFGPSLFALEVLRRNIVLGNFLTKQHLDGTPIWFLED